MALQALSVEFDDRAKALESETSAALLIGYGDDIGDRTAIKADGDGKHKPTQIGRASCRERV